MEPHDRPAHWPTPAEMQALWEQLKAAEHTDPKVREYFRVQREAVAYERREEQEFFDAWSRAIKERAAKSQDNSA